jgi:uncharacterized membrane protein YedE/YeeE
MPALLLVGNRLFGVSANLRHVCAAVLPGRARFFHYDWKRVGGWNLAFLLGIVMGGFIAAHWLGGGAPVPISPRARADLQALGIRDFSGLVPPEVFSWRALLTLRGAISVVGGGFLVGFGTAWAGGCTSGHGISGLASFQLPSLIAVVAFFVGGIAATFLLLPLLL